MVEFFRSDQVEKQNKAASENEIGILEMMFTGTLIEDLIATVERAEAKADLELMEIESWMASTQEPSECDSKLLGVA